MFIALSVYDTFDQRTWLSASSGCLEVKYGAERSFGLIRVPFCGECITSEAGTREPTQRQRLAVGAPNFLWTIKPLQI